MFSSFPSKIILLETISTEINSKLIRDHYLGIYYIKNTQLKRNGDAGMHVALQRSRQVARFRPANGQRRRDGGKFMSALINIFPPAKNSYTQKHSIFSLNSRNFLVFIR